MPHALLPGKDLTHGIVCVSAFGRIDPRMAATLARAASHSSLRHDNPRVLFDLRRARLEGGIQVVRELAGTFSSLMPRRLGPSVVLLAPEPCTELHYLERALRFRGYRVACFSRWPDALLWFRQARTSFNHITGATRAVAKSFIDSRLGIPRSQLERELADLYLCLQQLAANRGVNALRGAARVEADSPSEPRPRLSLVHSNLRPLRSA